MKKAAMALAGFVLAGLWGGAAMASAPQTPQGSYLQSCRDVRVVGGTLLAVCRQADGRWDTSALARVDTCVGDIGNRNGGLACNRGPLFGAARAEQRHEGMRGKERRLRCEGIVDRLARERCFHAF